MTPQEVTPHQYEVLYQAQLSARDQRAGCQNDSDDIGHPRAWTLHSHDEVCIKTAACDGAQRIDSAH